MIKLNSKASTTDIKTTWLESYESHLSYTIALTQCTFQVHSAEEVQNY
jgi:hypothetical protein